MDGAETEGQENVGLLVLEPKSFRPFKTKDEYLYAMKEDLAEWFKCLYEEMTINAENFMEILETGVLLCQHANEVRKFTVEQKAKGVFEVKSNFVRGIQVPEYDVSFRFDVKPGTFLARDNISNFITWTTKMGIPEVLRFETDDLVMRKNERSVVLCLLEVARVGAKFGMLAPTIVQMEEEIDNEIETGEPPPQIITCDVKSLDEMVRELVGRCTCPVQFSIIKVGEGKYKIGDNQTLVFVRILRKHVMIRVGGGWDTLEHYLDRHDPCRCGFQGHRGGGRAPSTPRRPSTTTVSHSLPNTPKTPRKLSMTLPASSSHSGNAQRSASPSIRSQSPGPSSRKLSLTVKHSSSQPGSTVTSPGIVNKQPNFSNVGLNSSGKQQTNSSAGLNTSGKQNVSNSGLNSSGGYTSLGSFVKQSHANLSRQISSGPAGSQQPPTPRRSASPAPRAQSPGPRRSESPAPTVSNRIRSPSPAPTNQKSVNSRTQSVPATQNGRCQSPIKQITLSELRSSRDGKAVSQGNTKPSNKPLKHQTSVQSNDGDAKNMESDLSMEKISTMSLGEFRNLLNTSLSMPNGNADSLCSDSPRSQSSVESYKNSSSKTTKKDKWAHVKSSYSYRPPSASKNTPSSKTSVTPSAVKNIKNADCSSSGYSSSSVSSDKTLNSYSLGNISTYGNQKTTVGHSVLDTPVRQGTKTVSNTSVRQVPSGGMEYGRPKTPTSISKSRSNMTSVSEPAYTPQQYGSRSSSHSSLKSYESFDSHLLEDMSAGYSRSDRIPLTPSSVNSDYSNSDANTSRPESPGYNRSNSYTPCSGFQERNFSIENNVRASSEPKDTTTSNNVISRSERVESKPLNVGYVSLSYQDKGKETKHLDELSELDNEIMLSMHNGDDAKSPNEETSSNESSENRKKTFVGRPTTPSLIPRPMTPKVTRKMSVPENNDIELSVKTEDERVGRPPTPRKSNVLARASGSTGGVRSTDRSKEQTYRQIFQKRSMTPGPGSVSGTGTKSSNLTTKPERRSSTPGPYLHKSSQLSTTSATTTRARLNQTLDQTRKRTASSSSSLDNQENKPLSRPLSRQGSGEQPETVITVNRSGGQHSLTVHNSVEQQTVQKSKVLARARTEDNRARQQTRTQGGITRQRPQSVEPRQLIPRNNSATGQVLSVKRGENGQHQVYDRTEEWVQTAVKQTTKVQKTKSPRTVRTPRTRRAMTPNSFDMKMELADEEPRSLDEIKAALTLPINGLNTIDTDKLQAPPEDPEMYYTMEKLFHELRQQELKASVNETPGSVSSGKRCSKSKSNSSNQEEEPLLDSNKNVKRKTLSVSTKSSSNVTSPSPSRRNHGSITSNRSQSSNSRPQPASRTSSTSSAGVSAYTKTTPSISAGSPAHPASPRTTVRNIISQNSTVQASSSTSSKSPVVARPSSPSSRTAVSNQRPPSPRTTVSSQRPSSPRTTVQPPRPESPRVSAQPPRPASPRTSTRRSPSPSPISRQPPRPASTPPRPCTPVDRKNAKSSDDNEIFSNETKTATSLITKIKEIIKVKPRKDKAESVKQKSRIPAPKSLANVGKSRSFSNLSNLSDSMSLAHTETKNNMMFETEQNGHDDQINGGLNVTLSGRSETPKLKLMAPMTTGRSTLIRKESMDKNKTSSRLSRVMSVEREMSGLQNTYQFYDDGEYV